MIRGKLFGLEKINKSIDETRKKILAGQAEAMQKAILEIHAEAIRSIQDNKDGKPQIRYSPKRIVNVSKPGDPPNTDTGHLVKGIGFRFEKGGLIGKVGTNVRYGAWLEFGTMKMAARPWLRPAVEKVTEKISKIFKESVGKAIETQLGRGNK